MNTRPIRWTVVDQLSYPRDMSRNPLFDTVFVMQNMAIRHWSSMARLRGIPYHNGTAKFDVTLEAVEREDAVLLNFEYNTALFRRDTIERLGVTSCSSCRKAIRKPEALIGEFRHDYGAGTGADRRRVQRDRSGLSARSDDSRPFEEQARRTPDRTAVTDPQRSLTYAELNAEANRWP